MSDRAWSWQEKIQGKECQTFPPCTLGLAVFFLGADCCGILSPGPLECWETLTPCRAHITPRTSAGNTSHQTELGKAVDDASSDVEDQGRRGAEIILGCSHAEAAANLFRQKTSQNTVLEA